MSEHLHNYQIIRQDEGGVVEVCRECKKKLITRKYNGRIDNRAYAKEHLRDTLQPFGPTKQMFERYYGKKKN